MRFLLARYARRHGFQGNKPAQWKRYHLCGAMLIPMNFALAGVVILVLHQEGGFHYGSMLGGDTRFASGGGLPLWEHAHLRDGAVRLLRHHLRGDKPGAHPKVQKPSTLRGPCDKSPVLSAARVVSLAAALVSMLSLEVAMLAQFGGGEFFRRAMIASTGGAVCFILVGMASAMIVRATKELKQPQT